MRPCSSTLSRDSIIRSSPRSAVTVQTPPTGCGASRARGQPGERQGLTLQHHALGAEVKAVHRAAQQKVGTDRRRLDAGGHDGAGGRIEFAIHRERIAGPEARRPPPASRSR
jgi:hypothetical protein